MIYHIQSKKEFHTQMNLHFKNTGLGMVFTGTNLFSDANMTNTRYLAFITEFANHDGFEGDIVDLKEFYDELPNEPETINLRKVDFEMLKGMLRHPGTTSVLSTLYSNPTQEELANLALFFEMLGKSSSFSHLAHKQLKS